MSLAMKYQAELDLEFEREIWGYSLLTVLQKFDEVPMWVLQPAIEVIQ